MLWGRREPRLPLAHRPSVSCASTAHSAFSVTSMFPCTNPPLAGGQLSSAIFDLLFEWLLSEDPTSTTLPVRAETSLQGGSVVPQHKSRVYKSLRVKQKLSFCLVKCEKTPACCGRITFAWASWIIFQAESKWQRGKPIPILFTIALGPRCSRQEIDTRIGSQENKSLRGSLRRRNGQKRTYTDRCLPVKTKWNVQGGIWVCYQPLCL